MQLTGEHADRSSRALEKVLGCVRSTGRFVAQILSLSLALQTLALIPFAPATAVFAADNPVVSENQQTGTTAWRIGSLISNDSTGQIKGYASATSISQGQSLSLYVTVNPAQSYTIDFYRVGWYGGLGGRLRSHVGPLSGVKQSACVPAPTTGLIACAWPASYTLTVPSDWTSGAYLALLTNAQGYQNYVVFVVRDGRPAPFLYQQSVATDQAYNNYPDDGSSGKSLYSHNSYGATTVAGDKRAVKVSFDRPYTYDGAGWFLKWEIDFIRWIERSGYDVTYSTDIDTHANGADLRNHKAFLSVGHDEYWSKEMYDAAQAALAAGTSLGFFGANDVHWQVRFENSAAGVPNRVMVGYKDAAIDPVQGPTTTVQWAQAPLNRPEQGLMGVQYTSLIAWGTSVDYVVANSAHWVYAGTGFRDGDVVRGIVGYEMDRFWPTSPSPSGSGYTLLSNSPFVDSGGLADHSNSSIYQAASGAWVFSAGTIAWSWGLDDFDHTFADVRLQRSTSNILDAFLSVGAPLPPPVLQISAVQVTNVASTSALVTWQTNNAANSRVDYGTTTSYGSVVTDAASVTGHSLTLPGLIPSTTYHYAVTSLDAFTQSAVSTDATFTTTGSAPNMISNPGFESGAAGWGLAASASIDTVPSDAHSGTGSLKLAATATWQGNWQSFAVTPGNTYTFGGWERSTTSGGYLSVFSYNASWVQLDQGTHLVYPGTGAWTSRSGTYVAPPGTAYALIGTQNSATGTFWFDDLTFSGGPPPALQISGVQATSNGTTSATVTWQTNNASNSRVDYGTTTAYGSAVTNASSASAHTISLSGLTPNTTYHYKVTSVDSFTQTTSSADATFTTTAPPLLQISAVQATGIGTTSATITWQTNNASNSRVDSGTTTAYGNVVTNATAVSAHTLNLAGLSSNTTYHYMVTSVDAYTQAASSTDATFTTSSVPPLLISAVQATSVGTASAVIGWQTTNASNSRVDYGTTTAYGGFLTNASSVSAHTMSLSGLTPNTTYHYRVTSVDAYTQSASSLDAIFVTTAASTNLVANPGFEGGTASWQLASSASVNTVAANAHSGTRSLRLVATAPWQGNWQSFAVTAGGTYTFSAWERSTTAGGYLSVFSYDANWVQIDQGTHVIYPVSSTWSSRTGTYVAPPGTAFALIGVHNSAAGTFWFDDISMTSP